MSKQTIQSAQPPDVLPADVGLTLAVTSSTGIMGLAVGVVGPPAEGSDAGPLGFTGGQARPGVEQLAEIEVVTDRRHAEEISPRLGELLDKAGVTMADLERLVIDIGPGRFTGLRVGLATVRALGFALELPVIGLTSLSVLAAGHRRQTTDRSGPSEVTAVIDARRSEVFQQSFVDGHPAGPPQVGTPELLADQARGVVVGDGVDRYLERYLEISAETGIMPVEGIVPSASVMVAMSQGIGGLPGPQVEPLYLREPDAKPNINTRVGSEQAKAPSSSSAQPAGRRDGAK